MLRKHLAQYNDEELRTEVKRYVDDQVQESKRLDYKEDVSLESIGDRREVAKDVSSFANEVGGTLIYGIPENRESEEVAVPKKPYGIEPIPGFESRLENVCIDAIAPHLPDLQIRRLETEYEGKVVYVVWHPESWMAPHMVQAYEDNRYYRRGLLRAVRMDEHEIREKYIRVQRSLERTQEFIESPEVNFYTDLPPIVKAQFVCVPVMLIKDRIDPWDEQIRAWLDAHRWKNCPWRRSLHGAFAVPQFLQAHGFCEVHRNGAVVLFKEAPLAEGSKEGVDFVGMIAVLQDFEDFLTFCGAFYDQVGYFEPVLLRLKILGFPNLGFFFLPRSWHAPGDFQTRMALRGSNLQVELISSTIGLVSQSKETLKAVSDLVYRAFGHEEADCFNPDMSWRSIWEGVLS